MRSHSIKVGGLNVLGLFARFGDRSYSQESPVSYTQHAQQCAALARRDGADDELTLAALLHDIGRLDPPSGQIETPSRNHAHWSADIVRPFVPRRVVQVIVHHVSAKRYLCTIDPNYARRLSPNSVRTLRLQGGLLSQEEVQALRADPDFEEALRLREWDDAGKVTGLNVPALSEHRRLLERFFGAQS
jgi:putative nucleotidyltransferase with HDIG domain